VNLDGSVNQTDVNLFVANYGTTKVVNTRVVGDLATRQLGDLDIDGDIDLTDAFTLRQALHGFGSGSLNLSGLAGLGSNVPEPCSLVLAVLGVVALVSGRRRQS